MITRVLALLLPEKVSCRMHCTKQPKGPRTSNFWATLVAQCYLAADFQLVTLKDIPIFRTTIPSKLQASLAAGVPVITTVRGDVADLIEEHDAGIVADPENAAALADAFARAYAMTAAQRAQMGSNARRLYEEHMSHAAGTTQITATLNNVTHQNARKVLVEERS